VWDLADGERRPLPAGRYTATLEAAGVRVARPVVVR
jgi:hypothetical protein